MSKWSDYQSPTRSFKPRNRPDDGHRLFVLGIVIVVGMIVLLGVWG